jgi:hypothetical protein
LHNPALRQSTRTGNDLAVEIPTVAKIRGWSQNVDDTKIELLDHSSPNQKTFDTKIAQREQLLKASPSDSDGVLFKNRIRLTPDRELLIYREDRFDHYQF